MDLGCITKLDGKAVSVEKKIYPNDPCPCGSGKKYVTGYSTSHCPSFSIGIHNSQNRPLGA